MLKTLMNRLAELRPNSDIRKIKLYAMQLYYLHDDRSFKISLYKDVKNMKDAYGVVMGLLKYEVCMNYNFVFYLQARKRYKIFCVKIAIKNDYANDLFSRWTH
uniref:Uncharacterized protein n=1 Tax=Rhizophagus irregularis (strain DAOM 181602 / DAOM 197198 / MUCL 43194) TaxID=747089 RepID=U9UFS9_RHIID